MDKKSFFIGILAALFLVPITSMALSLMTTSQIASSAITSSKIRDNAVTRYKIAKDAILGSRIATGAINTSDLRDDAVTRYKIAEGAVNGSRITDGTVGRDDLAPSLESNIPIYISESEYTFDFPIIQGQSCVDQTVTLPSTVSPAYKVVAEPDYRAPNGIEDSTGTTWSAWVSGDSEARIRACNLGENANDSIGNQTWYVTVFYYE